MRYKMNYKEWHGGGDCYGEYSFLVNGSDRERFLFGQRWNEKGDFFYGGYALEGGF